jgi:phosphoribosylamine--glycine ligase
VLVLGSGAREHALARALARSASVAEVIVAPGNAGTAEARPGCAKVRRAPIAGLDAAAVVALARAEAADLVVVGPEAPLVAGVADALAAEKIAVFGPSRDAAALEGSKAFLKRFATRHGIPTAPYVIASTMAEAEAAIKRRGAPIVVKADGLCAGKGVVVAETAAEALAAAKAMLVERRFGDAGAQVVIEDVIVGVEASVLALSDGKRLFVLPAARDHKRIGDGDTGPNTGGMGAFAPVNDGVVGPELLARVERTILRPTLEGMESEGRDFRGVLFAGLMITPTGEPFLLEHNVRFGDPECEALMALLDGDVGELLASAARGAIDPSVVALPPDRHALALVLAAAGYPDKPRLGDPITGIERAERVDGVMVHHAGTAEKDGEIVTAGGRVLVVTAIGASAADARARAYLAADAIHFEGMQFRRDIGVPRV